MNERRVVNAIRTITEETGYPPNVSELAAVLDVSEVQIQSALTPAKRKGTVRYDEAERLVLAASGDHTG